MIDDVTGVFTDGDPIADLERFTAQDVEPTRDAGDHVLESDRKTRGKQPEKSADAAEPREPDRSDQ